MQVDQINAIKLAQAFNPEETDQNQPGKGWNSKTKQSQKTDASNKKDQLVATIQQLVEESYQSA
jgi:hypothetical protein